VGLVGSVLAHLMPGVIPYWKFRRTYMNSEELKLEISRSEIEHLKAQVDNLKAQTDSIKKPFWSSVQFWTIVSGIVIACIGYTSTWQSQAAKDMNALVQVQLTSTKEKLTNETEKLSQIKAELTNHKQELAKLKNQKNLLTQENKKLKEFNTLLSQLTLENRERISALIFNELIESKDYLTEKLIDKEGEIEPQDIGETFAYIITKALIYRDIEVHEELQKNLNK